MASRVDRLMIIEHWFRLLISNDFCIDDIGKIMIEFGNEYEEFDDAVSHKRPDI